MEKLFTILIINLFAFGCQKPCKTRGQAKNEVDKKGY